MENRMTTSWIAKSTTLCAKRGDYNGRRHGDAGTRRRGDKASGLGLLPASPTPRVPASETQGPSLTWADLANGAAGGSLGCTAPALPATPRLRPKQESFRRALRDTHRCRGRDR